MCGLEWQKGRWWGLHPKKGFLSWWQRPDWQNAFLPRNSVSQPVSLAVRQPHAPLNLALCWAVTGLAPTLGVVALINRTMKTLKTRWEPVRMESLCHNTGNGISLWLHLKWKGWGARKTAFLLFLLAYPSIFHPQPPSRGLDGVSCSEGSFANEPVLRPLWSERRELAPDWEPFLVFFTWIEPENGSMIHIYTVFPLFCFYP